MRSFGSLAFKQVRARRLRSLLTTAGIVLGVAMILAVLLLTVTIHRTFNDLFDSVYGRTDLIVSGVGGDSVRHSTLGKVRRTPHVDEAQGQVTSVFTLVDRAGTASNDAGNQLTEVDPVHLLALGGRRGHDRETARTEPGRVQVGLHHERRADQAEPAVAGGRCGVIGGISPTIPPSSECRATATRSRTAWGTPRGSIASWGSETFACAA